MKYLQIIITVFAFCWAASSLAAGFLKYEGVDGESKASQAQHDTKELEHVSFTYQKIEVQNNQLWLVLNNGSKKRVTKDGVYRSSEGKTYVLKNGLLANQNANRSVVSPRDAASGMPTGKRQHKPLTATPPESNSNDAASGRSTGKR